MCFIFGIEDFKRKNTSKPILGEDAVLSCTSCWYKKTQTFDQTTISFIAAQLAKLQFKRRRTVEIQHGRVHVAAVGLEFAFATDLMDNGKSECVQQNDIINALANLSTDVSMFHVFSWCWPKALFCTQTGQIDFLFNFALDICIIHIYILCLYVHSNYDSMYTYIYIFLYIHIFAIF